MLSRWNGNEDKRREGVKALSVTFSISFILTAFFSISMFSATPARSEDALLSGTCTVSTTILIFDRKGGGYTEFTIEGEVASALRKALDEDRDGRITGDHIKPGEGNNFIEHIENKILDNDGLGIVYKGVWTYDKSNITDSHGLDGSEVNSTAPIYLYIKFKAEVKNNLEISEMNSEPVLNEIVRLILSSNNTQYNESSSRVSISCTVSVKTIWTPLGSLAVQEETESSTVKRFRIIAGEFLYFQNGFTYTGNSSFPEDKVEFWYWKWYESAIELGIFTTLSIFLTVGAPSRFAPPQKKKRVVRLHRGVIWASVAVALLYILAIFWFLLVLIVVLVLIGSHLVSWGVYRKGWFGDKERIPSSEKKGYIEDLKQIRKSGRKGE